MKKLLIICILILGIIFISGCTSEDNINSETSIMEFVLIPAGEFDMGSGIDNEGPVHYVKNPKPFYLSKYEVTQKQWREVMGSDPSFFKGDDLPVEQVSWNDVQEFIKKLNEREGAEKYRLPSEAEWEYAARGGNATRYTFEDDEFELDEYGWYHENSNYETHPIGQKKPNSWGLYDMHGNVWEWVQDEWHDSYEGAPTDGSAWEDGSGASRVIRDGCWFNGPGYWRSALRFYLDPCARNVDLGFRLLKEL